MEKKLLFFDIDGTLITEDKGKMPESAAEAVRKAKEEGHLLFINTGRTRASLPKQILDMGFDGYVCGCGTKIILRGEELFKAQLTNEMCREVAETVRSYHIPVIYEAEQGVYVDYQAPDVDKLILVAEEIFSMKMKDIEELLHSETLVYDKLLVFLELTEKNRELMKYLSERFICIDRGNRMYEITQKGYSKATGIAFLCEHLGKDLGDCYVFGDSENDRAMLEAVPNSIAMGNAVESIKRSCSYVTAHIEEDGIYKAMKHFALIK